MQWLQIESGEDEGVLWLERLQKYTKINKLQIVDDRDVLLLKKFGKGQDGKWEEHRRGEG